MKNLFALRNTALLAAVSIGLIGVAQAQPAAADVELCGNTPHWSGCINDDGSSRGCLHSWSGNLQLCGDRGHWRGRDDWDD
jgi:hypothetical protein